MKEWVEPVGCELRHGDEHEVAEVHTWMGECETRCIDDEGVHGDEVYVDDAVYVVACRIAMGLG